jgi:hypothetical protein
MTENKNKKKSVALAMAVSMVVANPLFTTGCSQSQPKIVVDEEIMEKEEEEQQQSSGGGGYVFSGSGRYNSPFIFHSSVNNSTGTTGGTISSSGWKTWTTSSGSSIKSKGYSGVRMSSLSS